MYSRLLHSLAWKRRCQVNVQLNDKSWLGKYGKYYFRVTKTNRSLFIHCELNFIYLLDMVNIFVITYSHGPYYEVGCRGAMEPVT